MGTKKKHTNEIILFRASRKNVKTDGYLCKYTVQSLYNTPHYNTDLDITWSCYDSQIFLPWNFTKEL